MQLYKTLPAKTLPGLSLLLKVTSNSRYYVFFFLYFWRASREVSLRLGGLSEAAVAYVESDLWNSVFQDALKEK